MGGNIGEEVAVATVIISRVSSLVRLRRRHMAETSGSWSNRVMDQTKMPREFTRTSCDAFMQMC